MMLPFVKIYGWNYVNMMHDFYPTWRVSSLPHQRLVMVQAEALTHGGGAVLVFLGHQGSLQATAQAVHADR